MPTMPGLTALKSGCHIPSGQPFTSICGGLVQLPLHSANTNTALNPLAPTIPGVRGRPAPGNASHGDVPASSLCSIRRDKLRCPMVPGSLEGVF